MLCAFERFDGKGAPAGLAGDEVSEAARFAAVGFAAVMFDAVGGPELAVATVARWSGRALDPSIAAVFLEAPAELLTLSNPDDVWAAVVDAEPQPRRLFRDDAHLDEALAGFGDAADLKSPFFQGHSRGVAALARAASSDVSGGRSRAGLPGRAGARPRPGRRPHRCLGAAGPVAARGVGAGAPAPLPLRTHRGPIAGAAAACRDREPSPRAHRRVGLPGRCARRANWMRLPACSPPRTSGTRSAKPARTGPALDPAEAARVISGMPLDRDAVRAVLRAADAPRPSFPPLPVDLTERELEVLRLLASGRTKRQIAGELFISHSTVHTHTVHIYAKCERLDPGRSGDVRHATRPRGRTAA